MLKKKTRVLVTHSVQFLSQCTNILVLKDGEIVEAGSYDDLFKQGGAFTRLIEEYGSHSKTRNNLEQQSFLSHPVTKYTRGTRVPSRCLRCFQNCGSAHHCRQIYQLAGA